MTEELRDPDLPPGAVVEVREDGSALRNNGVELKPAAENPWYVLATVHGEQKGTSLSDLSDELHMKNRRIWNGWACGGMDEARRAELAEAMGVLPEELAPLSDAERSEIEAAFRDRLGPDAVVPDPGDPVDFSHIHFLKTLGLGKCVLPAETDFRSATFSGTADFGSTTFCGFAHFASATFSRYAHFGSVNFTGNAHFGYATFKEFADYSSATFNGYSHFGSSTFGGNAGFRSAAFGGYALFGSTSFCGYAEFGATIFRAVADFGAAKFRKFAHFGMVSFRKDVHFGSTIFDGVSDFGAATFGGNVDFSNEAFGARTVFKSAQFAKVPRFYQRELHQDTSFTTEEGHWPTVTAEMAEEGKRAYTRLRQLMLELEKPDDAHFFFRQEMRCKAFEERHWWNRWPIRAFGWFSDYGYSLARPVLCLAALWIVPALIYHGAFTWRCVVDKVCVSLGAPFGLSFANIFPFGLNRLYFEPRFLQELGPGLKVLGGVQTVLGFLLLFLLGLGLRNRFRLR